jgi:hypothetical protein
MVVSMKILFGKGFTGKVKAMTMKDNNNEYYIYFADNKLIITIDSAVYRLYNLRMEAIRQ